MFNFVSDFESVISEFFGSKYAVATDSCTHAVELCLRLQNIKKVDSPRHTYLSIPMTFIKLGIDWSWNDIEWENYYRLGNTNIYDAAVLWKENSYISGSMMCLSFQFRKHLGLGRGGMILLDDYKSYEELTRMSYDGRNRLQPWADQNVRSIGYHYYMTPETAQEGIKKFSQVKTLNPKIWSNNDYPDLSKLEVFKNVK